MTIKDKATFKRIEMGPKRAGERSSVIDLIWVNKQISRNAISFIQGDVGDIPTTDHAPLLFSFNKITTSSPRPFRVIQTLAEDELKQFFI